MVMTTINVVIRELDGVMDSDDACQIKALRREQNAILRDPDRPPNFV